MPKKTVRLELVQLEERSLPDTFGSLLGLSALWEPFGLSVLPLGGRAPAVGGPVLRQGVPGPGREADLVSLPKSPTSAATAQTTSTSGSTSSNPVVGGYAGAPFTDPWGFTLPGTNQQNANYTASGLNFMVFLNPGTLAASATGASSNFMSVLHNSFPDWTFTQRATPLSAGSLVARSYNVGVWSAGGTTYAGAQLEISYSPHTGDPVGNMHWIQVVTSNAAPNQPFPTNENAVDNGGVTTNPYYDTLGTANGTEFYDAPKRLGTKAPVGWSAELCLVQETGPQADTIYGAVPWGWGNVRVGTN